MEPLFANAWVENGVENPDLRVLKVVPESGYWDTKDGKLMAGIKIATLRSLVPRRMMGE